MPYAILALAFVLAPALLSNPAQGQIGNPGFMMPDTGFDEEGLPLPHQTNAEDRLFAILTAEGNLAEIQLGELAAEKAEAEAVREFAQRMVEDHTTAGEELAAIAEESSVPLPEELNAEHQAMLQELEQLDGADFDLAYMRGQLVDHQKTTQLLLWEITLGQDAALQRFAAGALPQIIEHLEQARTILGQMTQTPLAVSAPPPED